MRKIAIRIDDVTPEMDWIRFSRFAALLDRYGVCPLIGVVPCNRDTQLTAAAAQKNADFTKEGAYAAWLRDKQTAGWRIAVHGCYHHYTTTRGGLFPLNRFSEYAGQSYEAQLALLRKGREVLQQLGVETDIFMAPAHSYDKNTLRALRDAGYRYVTDGYGSVPYTMEGLTFLPISFLRSRERKKKDGYTTYVVHTWEMNDTDYDWYEKLFEAERDRVIDYAELLAVTPVRRGAAGRLLEYTMATGKRLAAAAGRH